MEIETITTFVIVTLFGGICFVIRCCCMNKMCKEELNEDSEEQIEPESHHSVDQRACNADDNQASSAQRITITINGTSTIEIPMGDAGDSLAQRIIEMCNNRTAAPLIPASASQNEARTQSDVNRPPNYNEVTAPLDLPLSPRREDQQPPNYDEATALAPPPAYEVIR